MKIAQIAPLYEAVPPKLYGGTERLLAHLSQALAQLGHEVTVFASADSQLPGCILSAQRPQALRLDSSPLTSDVASHLAMLDEVRRRADEFDVLHFHTDLLHLPFFEDMAERTLTTLHGRLDLQDLPHVYRRWRQYPLVSISNDQRRPLPFAHWAGTVYHGLDPQQYKFHARPTGQYLAFLGRISPEKRPDRAIRIAQQAGIPLKIAAKVDGQDKAYYEQTIKPLLQDPNIEFVGEINDQQKSEFLGNACGLLFPIDWPEPFGLVMIEAMACGTPVIAFRCGSVPEVVDPNVTGFIVDTEAQAVAACQRLDELDRAQVRQQFCKRFSAQTMASAYVGIYQQLLQHPRPAMTVQEAG